MTIKRTFDLLDHTLSKVPREDIFGGKANNEWVTYNTKNYVEESRNFALGLIEKGFQKGDIIATISTNRPEWNFIDMGIALSGAIHLPVYPTISEEDYLYILKHAEVKLVVISDEKLLSKLQPVIDQLTGIQVCTVSKIEGVTNWKEISSEESSSSANLVEELEKRKASITEEEVVTMIYTSGTTGTPKGVMLTHKNLISNFIAQTSYHNLGEGHRAISFLPLCHIYERSLNYHFIYKGIAVYYVENLAGILPAITEIKPHIFNTVPRLLERIYDGIINKGKQLTGFKKSIFFWAVRLGHKFDYGKKFGPFFHLQRIIADKLVYSKWRAAMGGNIEVIVSGGAALQGRILSVFGIAKITTLEGYGLTETSPVIAVSNPLKEQIRVGTVGPPLTGVQVKIAEDGEILCKGPGVMKGYYKEPQLTAEVIDKDGWFHTGDVGCFVEDIYLKITDRKKEIFKLSGGKYIAPQMIENKLKESFFIEQAMVVGENQKFASAIISPNFDYLHDWCSKQKLHFENNKALIELPEVQAEFQKEVKEVNKQLGQVEQINRFKLVCEAWTPNTGELSPTLKLKRQFVYAKYQNLVDQIYGKNKAEDDKTAKLSDNFNELKNKLKL